MKRFLALLLTLTMAVSLFAVAAPAAFAEGNDPFTSFAPETMGALYHIGYVNATAENDGSYAAHWGTNYSYLAQEFVPSGDKVGGAKLGMVLTSDKATIELEVHKGSPEGDLIGSTSQSFVSRGNVFAMYDFDFKEDLTVVPGDVYYLVFVLSYRHAGTACIVGGAGGTAATRPLCRKVMGAEGAEWAATGSVAAFEILGADGWNESLNHFDTTAGVVIPGGNVGLHGTTGQAVNEGMVEGVGANKSGWTGTNIGDGNQQMYICVTNIEDRDFTDAKYIAIDVFVHDFEINPDHTGVLRMMFGNDSTAWSSANAFKHNDSTHVMSDLKAGWNKLIIPIDESDWLISDRNVKVISIRWEGGDAANHKRPIKITGSNPYVLFDNMRVLDEAGKAALEAQNEPEDPEYVDVQFRAMDKANDLAGMGTSVGGVVTDNALEGTGAVKYNHTGAGYFGMYVYSLGQAGNPIDISGAEYLILDVYASADGLFNNATNDAQLSIDDTNNMNKWQTSGGHASSGQVLPAFKGIQKGWNHLKIKLDAAATCTNVGDFRLFCSNVPAFPEGAYTLVDDIRFVDQAYIDGPYAGINTAKDATAAINALPALDALTLDDAAAVAAAKAAVEAVDAKYASNIIGADKIAAYEAKLAELEAQKVVDLQYHGCENRDGIVIAAGNQGTNLTQGAEYTATYTEGSKSHFSNWIEPAVDSRSKLYLSIANSAGLDVSEAKYLTFDIYVHGWKGDWVAGQNDCNIMLGSDVAWSSGDLFAYGNSKLGPAANAWTEGWNHVVVPLNKTITTPVKSVRIYFENAIKFTAADPYVLFDDFRFVNEKGLAVDQVRTEAKKVISAIAELDEEDEDGINAAKAAYDALSEDAQGYVTNYAILEDLLEKIAPPEAEPAEVMVHDFEAPNHIGCTGSNSGVAHDTTDFTHGVGSLVIKVDNRKNIDTLIYGSNESNSSSADNTTDITPAIDEDGTTYFAFDFYLSDTDIVTKNRLVMGLICRTDTNANVNNKNAWLELNTQNGKNVTWQDYGFENGKADLKVGWNHAVIKLDTSEGSRFGHATNSRANYWDPTRFWEFRVLADSFDFTDREACIKFDNMRFMNTAAYEANYASEIAVADTVIAINEIPDASDAAGIDAAQAKYDALTDAQKAEVKNYARLEALQSDKAIDIQYHACETNAGMVIAAGNQGTNGTQGKAYDVTYVEGSKSHFSNWGSPEVGGTGKLYMSITNGEGVDVTGATYVAFDIYVHGWEASWVAGRNDCNFMLGSDTAWSSGNLFNYGNGKFGPMAKSWTEGWNHVVIPIPATLGTVKNVRIYFEHAITFTAADAYVLFDDVRFMNDKAKEADEIRTQAKSVIADIAELKAGEDEAIAAVKAEYDALSEDAKAYVTNYSRLALLAEIAESAAEVNAMIEALGDELTYADKADIMAAKDAYDALVDAAKALVTDENKAALNAAVAMIETVEANAKAVADEIEALPAVEDLAINDEAALTTARAHYEALTDEEKALVENVDALEALEAKMAEIKAEMGDQDLADAVAEQIEALPAAEDITVDDNDAIVAARAAYDALTDAQKALVENVDALEAAEAALAQAKTDKAAADDVTAAVEALPEAKDLTLEDKADIEAARAAYDALNDKAKAYVADETVDALEAVEAAYDKLAEDTEGAAAVTEAVAELPAAADVTVDDKDAIQGAKAAYDALSDEGKAMVSEETVAALKAAVTALKLLLPVDVQFRAFDQYGADVASQGNGAKEGKTTTEQLEGEAARVVTYSENTQQVMIYTYDYNQAGTVTKEDLPDGCIAVPIKSATDFYLVFDLYVSDAAALLATQEDWGVGIDALETGTRSQWGNFARLNKVQLKAALEANGGLKDGWNHLALPMKLQSAKQIGTIVHICSWRFYFRDMGRSDFDTTGMKIMMDDVRFMDAEAVETIQPNRVAAKDLTLAIRDLDEDFTIADGKAIVDAYEALDAEYQDIVLGYEEFKAAYDAKVAECTEVIVHDFEAANHIGVTGSHSGVDYDTANFTNGIGALSVKLDNRTNGDFLVYGNNESNSTNATTDISSAIAADGSTYFAFDFYVSDPSIVKNNRLVMGLICKTAANQNINNKNAWLELNTQNGRNTTWEDYGFVNGKADIKAGWNHAVIKLDTNEGSKYGHATNSRANYWDPTQFWTIRVLVDAFNFTGKEGCIKFDNIRFMNPDYYDNFYADEIAVADTVIAINEMETAEDVVAAQAKYDALTEAQKAEVAKADKIEEAAKAFADEVADMIDALTAGENLMFNDCEDIETALNCNSGAEDKAIVDGAAKFINKNAGVVDSQEAFRNEEGVDVSKFTTLEFDLFVDPTSTIEASGWGNLILQSAFAANGDSDQIAKISIADALKAAVPGQWNHIAVNYGDKTGTCVQVVVRAFKCYNNANAGGYIMIDNVQFTGAKEAHEITVDDKEAIEAARAAYDALPEEIQAMVANAEDLEAAEEALAAAEKAAEDKAAVEAVAEKVEALPEEITVDDAEAVEAVRAAYDALTDDQKAIAADVLAGVEAAEKALADAQAAKKAADDKAAADEVVAAVDALKAPADITDKDADAIQAARAAYDALTDDQKALVPAETVAKLEAAEKALAEYKPYTLGDINGDGKINAADALQALKAAVGKVTLTDNQKLAADVNKDGKVNASDALAILKKSVGKPAGF